MKHTIHFLEEQAIDAAVNLKWEQAIEINNRILEIDSHNLGAYLRLGFAYMQHNDIEHAQKSYKKALSIQPKNHIALENVERLRILAEKKSDHHAQYMEEFDSDLFLETPGKTKTIQLVNIGKKDDIASLIVGQKVELKLKKRKLEVRTTSGIYIGTLPDDLSRRMIYFLQEGTIYKTYIKEATLHNIVLFVREIQKGEKVRHLISFPQNTRVNMPPTMTEITEKGEADDEEISEEEDTDLEEEAEADMPEEIDKDILRYRETHQEDDESEE